MTVLYLLLPAALAIVVGLGFRAAPSRLHPRTAAIVLVLVAVLSALSFLGALALVAVAFVTQYGPLADLCRAVSASHDSVPPWMGFPAIVSLVLVGLSVGRTFRGIRRPAALRADSENLQVLDTPRPTAYAVPGRPGHIVVSVGMLRALPAPERRVLLAHERSHLERGHHRYLHAVELAAAAAPVLRCLKRQVRHATERWADEDAADRVGDRRLVASALARASLAGTDFGRAPAMGLVGGSVPARIDALLAEPASTSMVRRATLLSLLGLTAAFATSTVQMHHLLAFANHVCPSWA